MNDPALNDGSPNAADRPAPVAVFAYKRPVHLARTLEALAANAEAGSTDVVVYCDAARRPEDMPAVEETRSVASGRWGFASVTTVLRHVNFGLARSIIDGVTRMLEQHDRIIVLEDDIVVSPHFLRYMNDGLTLYADDERVASIHAYTYPVTQDLPETFFLRGADCWGWATWARAWRHFRADGSALLAELKARRLTHQFDLNGAYPYTRMLEDQIAGRNDSWAVRWHASCFLREMLTLYPGRSLAQNIGNDDSGTHSGSTSDYDVHVLERRVRVQRIELAESLAAAAAVSSFFRRKRSLPRRVFNRLRRWYSSRRMTEHVAPSP